MAAHDAPVVSPAVRSLRLLLISSEGLTTHRSITPEQIVRKLREADRLSIELET